jgi:type IV fimbrial biogenesis protein FimT
MAKSRDTGTTRPTARRHARGVSLIESLVVVAVLGTVTTAALPAMRGVVENRRIDDLAVRLAADVQHARSHAVTRHETVRLSVLRSCYVVHTGPAADCRCVEGGEAVCEGRARALVSRTWQAQDPVRVQAGVSSLAFDPLLGTVTPTATLRIVGPNERAVHHVVNVMGRLRSCSPQAAVPGYRSC